MRTRQYAHMGKRRAITRLPVGAHVLVLLFLSALALPSISVAEDSAARGAYALRVVATPADSRVRIMNIGPRYRDGIRLSPGRYHIRVDKPGYETQSRWITVRDQDVTVRLALQRSPTNSASTRDGDSGSAPCTVADGYSTVSFSNGASYSGSFLNCEPLGGPAVDSNPSQGIRLQGTATPVGGQTVRLSDGYRTVTITLRITYQ